MVLVNGGVSGPLPPLGGAGVRRATARSGSAPGSTKPIKSLKPHIAGLAQKLVGTSDTQAKGACSELALLTTQSISACVAVAEARIEPQLAKALKEATDPAMQCWGMSVLSNCAAVGESLERQTVAIPALTKLIASPVPEVQHAAALHLATLSHSDAIQSLFGQNRHALAALRDIEAKVSKTLAGPGKRSLQQEAAQYARWALRTAQGRNYKPAYKPKTEEQLRDEATVAIQSRVRSSFVAQSYRSEMKQRRAAATILQAGYRSHKSRDEIARELLVQGPAAALLQGVVRGRKYRKEQAEARSLYERQRAAAAASLQAGVRGRQARTSTLKLTAQAKDGSTLHHMAFFVNISVRCTNGNVPLVMKLGDDSGAAAAYGEGGVGLSVACSDGALPLTLRLVPPDAAVRVTLLCSDGDLVVPISLT